MRFKFILDGKYEVFKVSTKGEHINGSNEVKIDFAKQWASIKTGLKGKLTPYRRTSSGQDQPGFGQRLGLPKVVTRASAVAEEMASGSAFLEALGVWAGAFSLALPISLALRDFSLYLCRCARESGIKDGQMMVFADAYVKTLYGLDAAYNPQDGVMRVKDEGRKKAVEDMNRYGRVHLQLYLEKHFNNSQRCADQDGNAFNRMQITAVGEGLWL